MDVSVRASLQLYRLKELVWYVYDHVPFYKKKFDEKGVHPRDIRSLEDIRLLPMTTKTDLRDNYPYGLFAVPMEKIVRIHASSGTTGKPTVVGYTASDIALWSEVMARSLVSAGATKHSIIQNAYGYGLFTGGLGVHYGAERIGATVIPISGGNTARQLLVLEDFGPDIITCTPSYSLYLAEEAHKKGLNLHKLNLKYGLFGAEPWSEAMRDEIERMLPIKAINIYGLSEIIGPGVACECLEQKGLHIYDDHFYPEILNPATGEPVAPGEQGELVITTLTKEGIPLIRYRTRDLTRFLVGECACGRTYPRIDRIMGRTDDMLIIRGVNVFPSQIEEVLVQVEEASPHYVLIVDRENNLDVLTVMVEVNDRVFSDEIKGLETIEQKIRHEIQNVLGISVMVKLVEPRTIERSEGKAKRIIDNRKL
ncbi:phenylacetate--CoA ligase [Thermospira aquatica]|uniref:Phenylacetate-coenzyme A ligase n=2 Tax=Thermospira aquatica TaxID=2828656 RepID=A0AAX3BGU3_9SPIR|nr:phenylacetate--CoA ligase [Thermospira aquatica]